MKKSFFLLTFLTANAMALTGIENLEKKVLEKNPEVASLISAKESEEALYKSTYSNFLPALDAVGGWDQITVDDPLHSEKGYYGYLNAKFNLFRGFRDQNLMQKQDIQVALKSLDIEQKKRELRKEIVSIASDMIYLHRLEAVLVDEWDLTKNQKKMAARIVAAGITSGVDNLELEIRESEIEINRRQIAQLHAEAHERLFKLTGENIPESEFDRINFSPLDELTKDPGDFSLEKSISYKRAVLLTVLSEKERKEVRSEFMPSVDLLYTTGRLTPLVPSLANYNESKYGIQITIPLFSGLGTYYRNSAARELINAREKEKTAAILDVQASVNILKEKKKELLGLYEINEKKQTVSKKYYDMTFGEYTRGIKNSPDLVGATERWFNAQKRKYELLRDLEATQVQIQTYY